MILWDPNVKGIKVTIFSYFSILELIYSLGIFDTSNFGRYIIELLEATDFLAGGYLLLNYNGNREIHQIRSNDDSNNIDSNLFIIYEMLVNNR